MTGKVPENARLEIKFVANFMELSRIKSWVRLHVSDFYCPFPDRWVNNVYFDSHDYFSFAENLTGISKRSKLRYRWYGGQRYPDIGILEVKCKRNLFGWKQYFRDDTVPFSDGDSWRDFRDGLAARLGPEAKLWLDMRPVPTILNRYYRRYFVTRDNAVRLTIDSHQYVYDQRYSSYPNISRKTNIPDTLVVEIKFDRHHRDLASQVIQGLPIRAGRNSKYVIGLRSAHQY